MLYYKLSESNKWIAGGKEIEHILSKLNTNQDINDNILNFLYDSVYLPPVKPLLTSLYPIIKRSIDNKVITIFKGVSLAINCIICGHLHSFIKGKIGDCKYISYQFGYCEHFI